MIHPEIKCPYCRIQFGSVKINEDNSVEHLDTFWSSDAGLIKKCEQPELVTSNLKSIDEYGNPTFTDEFQNNLTELSEKFENNPDDITKENFDFDSYMIAFNECMNYGYVNSDDEDYDRENITIEKLKQLWEMGYNLNEALKAFIVKT
jgi:hypothetical protein